MDYFAMRGYGNFDIIAIFMGDGAAGSVGYGGVAGALHYKLLSDFLGANYLKILIPHGG